MGRRVEVQVDQRTICAAALDTGEIACEHQRMFAKHRTTIALQHARTQRESRRPVDTPVQTRPLDRYDQLIA